MTTPNEQMREKARQLCVEIRRRVYGDLSKTHEAFGIGEAAFDRFIATALQEAHAAGRQEILDSARTPADIKRDIDSGALTNPVIVFDRMLKAMAPANGVETPEDIAMDIVERWSQNYMDTMRPAAHHDLLARITSAIRIVREGK